MDNLVVALRLVNDALPSKLFDGTEELLSRAKKSWHFHALSSISLLPPPKKMFSNFDEHEAL